MYPPIKKMRNEPKKLFGINKNVWNEPKKQNKMCKTRTQEVI